MIFLVLTSVWIHEEGQLMKALSYSSSWKIQHHCDSLLPVSWTSLCVVCITCGLHLYLVIVRWFFHLFPVLKVLTELKFCFTYNFLRVFKYFLRLHNVIYHVHLIDVGYNITELTEGEVPVASPLNYTMTIGIHFHHCTNVSV